MKSTSAKKLDSITFYCLLVNLLILAPSSTSGKPTHVTSPLTNIQVPLSLLAARVPDSHRDPIGLSAHLFEWNPKDNVIRSSHHEINLAKHLKSRIVRHSPSTKITLNGTPYSTRDHGEGIDVEAVITSSADGSVEAVYHGGELIHVWGGTGLRLSPLNHPDGHQTLFVAERLLFPTNKQTTQDAYVAMLNDEIDDHNGMAGELIKNMTEEAEGEDSDSSVDSFASMEPDTPTNECRQGVPHYLEVAAAYDNSLCRFYNNSPSRTLAMIAVLFEISSRPYLQDTCVRLALTYLEGHCQDPMDPYERTRSLISIFLISEFVSVWRQPERLTIPRDIVMYISGFNDGSAETGFGFPGAFGGVCSPRLSFGWCEGIIPGVFARAIGFMLDAGRSDTGLMQPIYEPRVVIQRFAQKSINEITTFIDTNSIASCISTTPLMNTVIPTTTSIPAPTLVPEYGTCNVSRRDENVLSCTEPKILGRITPPSNLTRLGSLRVRSWQDYGTFHVDVAVVKKKAVEIREFRGAQHFNRTIYSNTFGVDFRDDGSDLINTTTVRLDRESVRIRWPRALLTCCDQRMYIFLNIRWCLKPTAGDDEVCATVYKRLSRKVPCVSPCSGKEGHVLKMGPDRQCPSCETL